MIKIFKIIFFNILFCLFICFLFEIFCGSWIFSKNKLDNLGIPRNANYIYQQERYSFFETVKYTRDDYGLRGDSTYNNPSSIDILTIGGSTTDCRYITDSLTWQSLLQNKIQKTGLSLNISNAGVDGQSTFGHIKNFQHWFPLLNGKLKPKYILFYIGINDVYRTSENSIYDDLTDFFTYKYIKFQLINKSFFYSVYRKFKGLSIIKSNNIGHDMIDFANFEYVNNGIAQKEFFDFYKKEYIYSDFGFENRIKLLIDESIKLGAEPIFITQPNMMYKFIDNELFGINNNYKLNGMLYNGVDYFYLLNLLNKAIEDVCFDRYQVIDLTNLKSWNNSHFYDFYHMNVNGTKKLADEIFIKLNKEWKY